MMVHNAFGTLRIGIYMTYDLIIRGGTIADGRGNPLFEADIAVIDGKIVEVGSVSGPAKEVIDASGLLVTPGFVDIHSHYDGQGDHHRYGQLRRGVRPRSCQRS
jgi:N-acyl-D-aspartate/D-glutamate deacylase